MINKRIIELQQLIAELESAHEILKQKNIHAYNNCSTLLGQYKLELVRLKEINKWLTY